MKILAYLITLSGLAVSAAHARDWVEYTSEHFTIYSDAQSIAILPLIRDFEVFRQAALSSLRVPDSKESDRLVIVVYGRSREFSDIAPQGAGGFFYHSIYGPRMIVGPGRNEFRRQTLFHEYVHYLMNRNFAFNFPRWYSEGMASLLGSTQIFTTSVRVGEYPVGYEYSLGGGLDMSVSDVVDAEPDPFSFDFYVTAWLLMHYLSLDYSDGEPRTPQLLDYLRRYNEGEELMQTFENSFGMTPSEMQNTLWDYVRDGRIGGLEYEGFGYRGKIDERPINEDERLYVLGDIAVELNRHESAYAYFDALAELDANSAYANKAKSRRAISLIHEDRVDEGDALIAEILETRDDDPDLLADLAHYAYDRYVYGYEELEEFDVAELERAIAWGEQAVAESPTDLEALYYLGLSYESRGDLQESVDTLLQSYRLNPSVPSLNQGLARVMIRGRQTGFAINLLNRIHSGTHDEDLRSRIISVIEQIEDGQYDIDSVISELWPAR